MVSDRAPPYGAIQVGHDTDKEDLQHDEDDGHEEKPSRPALLERFMTCLPAQTTLGLYTFLHLA